MWKWIKRIWNAVSHVDTTVSVLARLGIGVLSSASVIIAWFFDLKVTEVFAISLGVFLVTSIVAVTFIVSRALTEQQHGENEPKRIPLPEACKRAYEETQDTYFGKKTANKFGPNDILNIYATAITESCEATLYGTKPPSEKAIEIPKNVFGSYMFYDSATRFSPYGNKDVGYHFLAVMSDELEASIDVIKSWEAHISKKMSLIELRDEAVKKGWLFGPDSLQGSEFVLALSQAGLDEEIQFWGKQDINDFETLSRQEPDLEILKEHWKQFKVEVIRFETTNDNFAMMTVPRRGTGRGYRALQVKRDEAMDWLITTAEKSKVVDMKKWQ
jgi:hypothetical protein